MTNIDVFEKNLETRRPGYQAFLVAESVPAGEWVADGYGESRAPKGEGVFDLIEVADTQNCHFCWVWMQGLQVVYSSRPL